MLCPQFSFLMEQKKLEVLIWVFTNDLPWKQNWKTKYLHIKYRDAQRASILQTDFLL